MRKTTALVAALATCGAIAGAANAGEASIDADGNILTVDASFDPPNSSSKRTIQGVTLEVHSAYGNFRGNPGPSEGSDITFGLPKGSRVNSLNFPKCPLPTEQSEFGVQSRCPSTSKIGSGKVSVDARPSGIQNQLKGTLTVYNGAASGGRPTLMMMAEIPNGESTIRTEINFRVDKGPKLVQFDPLGRPRGGTAFSITALDLKVGRTIRSNGERFPYFEAPTTCKKSWAFELALVRNSSTTSAKDTQPCLRLVG